MPGEFERSSTSYMFKMSTGFVRSVNIAAAGETRISPAATSPLELVRTNVYISHIIVNNPEREDVAEKMSNPSQYFFNLDDKSGLARQIGPGLNTRIFVGHNLMLSIVEVEPHAAGPIHSHDEEQWGILLSGSGVRTQSGEDHPV